MSTSPLELVPPVDGLDLLVDGNDFLIVRVQNHDGERVRVGIQDSSVRVLLAVRSPVQRVRYYLLVAGVIAAVALVFFLPAAIGLPPLLGLALAVTFGIVGLMVVLIAQPTREYRFHDDLPGGLDREPLMTLAERSGQQSWYALRDERGWIIGDISKRLGRWRVRGFEPIEPPPLTDDEQLAESAAEVSKLAGMLYAWSMAMGDDEPSPEGPAPEVTAAIVRDYLNLASIIGGLISGPVGIAMALNGPWKRMEFRRGGSVVATGYRLDDGSAMRLEIAEAFDFGGEQEAWVDRRHLLALAVLSLSLEAER